MKKTLLPLLSLALATPCLAETIPALFVKTDKAELHISLADISKVRYTETEMCITLRNGDQRTFVIDDIRQMKFADIDQQETPTGIPSAPQAKQPLSTFRLDGVRKATSHTAKTITIIQSDKDTRKVVK